MSSFLSDEVHVFTMGAGTLFKQFMPKDPEEGITYLTKIGILFRAFLREDSDCLF